MAIQNKKVINMLSSATNIKGQGVGSAYIEQVKLVKEGLSADYEIVENKLVQATISHFHTIDLKFYFAKKWLAKKGVSVGYVHMLPETVEQSLQMPQWLKKRFLKYMIKFYKAMDYLVTVNPYFIGELAKYGVPKDKVTFIPNFVSGDDFYKVDEEKKRSLREEYDLPLDRFTVLCAGQLQTRKGVFDVIKMAQAMPDVQFVWAGGFSFGAMSDGYQDIKRLVKHPPSNMKFLGIVDRSQMNDIFNLADVMLLASFEELFPMTILEAMCLHLPIVLRDLEIYEDILFDYYQKASNVQEFVRLLYALKEDQDFYQQAVADSKRGNEFYSKEHVLEMWQAFYDKVSKGEPV